jgi:cytosine/adenosine deaminase-related metal-dependent hydrolase
MSQKLYQPLKPYRIQAGWLITLQGDPLRGGCLLVQNGRIAAIEKKPQGPIDYSWLDEIVLPGLVNAHTHLEFSGLQNPFPSDGGFTRWVQRVVQYRQQQGEGDALQEIRERFLRAGWRESQETGSAWLADIATAPYRLSVPSDEEKKQISSFRSGSLVKESGLDTSLATTPFENKSELLPPPFHNGGGLIALGEMIGWAKPRQESSQQWYGEMKRDRWCNDFSDCMNCTWGISPHAPYSTSPELIEWCVEESAGSGVLLAMHLAETLEEIEWIEARKGTFAELLSSMGVDTKSSAYRWPALSDYLDALKRATRSLVIHGNYLAPENWDFLAANRERMSVVFCPRTHRHFDHSAYPLQEMLQRGVRVCVGTDSRASSPDLNLWKELQEIRRCFGGIHPSSILGLGTTQGAEALGIAGFRGCLEVGGAASFIVSTMRTATQGNDGLKTIDQLWEALLDSDSVDCPRNPFWNRFTVP